MEQVIAKPPFILIESEDPELSSAITTCASEIDAIWNRNKSELGDALFDGGLFHCYSVEPVDKETRLYIQAISYRHFIAAQEIPEKLRVRPLGVCGVSLFGKESPQILFGRRADTVAIAPGLIELAPSGTVDAEDNITPNLELHLRKEFNEETHLDEKLIDSVRPLLLVFDQALAIYDICFEINIKESAIKDLPSKTKEYSEFFLVDVEKLQDFVDASRDDLLPTSFSILQNLYSI